MGVIHPFGGLMPPSNFYDVALQQQQQRLQMNQQQQRPASVSAPSDNSSVSRSTTASSSTSGNSSLRLQDASPPTSALHSELVKAAIHLLPFVTTVSTVAECFGYGRFLKKFEIMDTNINLAIGY
ncbi:unnamed protein product [Dibothriocephalus latus]|uniref:Uncharacterized protein n=1 Tax=Dibothriocephalus latus TaxID=60516 RepID=A0A3P7LP95_DIBLA|nr:unnamed protein product [Dibothriocephalus latus]